MYFCYSVVRRIIENTIHPILRKEQEVDDMKVYEIMSTRRMFESEVSSEYVIVYEEAACRQILVRNHSLSESEEKFKKKVHLFKGNERSTLQRIHSFSLSDKDVLADMRKTIKDAYPEVFV